MNDQENGFQKKDALKNCKSCDIFFKNGCANSYNIASNEKCRKNTCKIALDNKNGSINGMPKVLSIQ